MLVMSLATVYIYLCVSVSVVSAVVVGLLAVCCTTSQCALMMTAGLVLAVVLATLMLFARPVLTLLVSCYIAVCM